MQWLKDLLRRRRFARTYASTKVSDADRRAIEAARRAARERT